MNEFQVTHLQLTIPLTPPSVNHYKKRARSGHWFVTEAAKAFKAHIWHAAGGRFLKAKRYGLEATVYLGKGSKGDGDNFWKVIADGLKDAQVIHSDAAVTDWIMRVRRDRTNPRTEIEVTALREV
jgi:Holliday junction resolvase RusA-like endonuclease